MTLVAPGQPPSQALTAGPLQAIENRVLWLSTAIIDHANRVRANPGGLKVGGHQASSASMVSIMTALWFGPLKGVDRVSVKPHASPVLHAIDYLLGTLDESHLTTLRAYGGLQAYPSRDKDPDHPDYSTGSVGLGATAPVWGALARRYVDGHFGDAGTGRQYSLIGDAELDEGACWEAIMDPLVTTLGEVVWIVDLNRQSLDRVVPSTSIARQQRIFEAAGWQVLTVKYGVRLTELFTRVHGQALLQRIDTMSNAEYQRLLRCDAAGLRARLPGDGPDASAISAAIADLDDDELVSAIGNLGGHELPELAKAFAAIDDTRPTIIFAYTIKGYGLPIAGHPQNHSAILPADQLRELAVKLGADLDHPWARFEPGTEPHELCAAVAQRLQRSPRGTPTLLDVPADLGHTTTGMGTTQAALGRTLLDLKRAAPDVSARVVTVSPDVSSSTNLGGWVNSCGVWAPDERVDWFADDADTILHWQEQPKGQHIELGIAETNMVGLLGELGATWSRWGQPLLPIGVVYDPFVERALEPWTFGIYGGGQSLLVGTPSGVSLASEGGAHQSVKTPSIGLEQPRCLSYEPAFVADAEWTILAALNRLGRPDGCSAYIRLSTRPIDQKLAAMPSDPAARERRRRHVVAGAYLLRRTPVPTVTIAAMGAVVPQALTAADRLTAMGFPTDVICVTSADLLFRAVQSRRGLGQAPTWILDTVFAPDRATPLVTVLDGHPHSLAFLAGVNGVPATHLGVTTFGQSGDLESVYRHHEIDVESIVSVCLDHVD
jgi:pyruvate dehydrogenase E1 component